MEFCFLKESRKIEEVLSLINKEKRLNIVGGDISFFAFLISILFHHIEKNFIVILPTEKKCEIFYYDILNFVDKKNVKFLPSPDYNSKEATETGFERIERLIEILEKKEKFILVSYPSGLIKKIPRFDVLKNKICKIKKGIDLRRDEFINFLFSCGYEEKEIVEMPGEFARRGSIIDFFPLNSSFPIRINFSGNKVESIRKFEVSSQISFEKIDEFQILPLNEFYVGDEDSDIFQEIENKIIFLINPDEIKFEYIECINKKNYPVDIEIFEKIKEMSVFLTNKILSYAQKFIYFNIIPVNERFKIIPEKVIWQQNENEKIFLFYENNSDVERLKRTLEEKNLFYKFKEIEGNLSTGFTFIEENLTFLTINEIFSRYKARHPLLKKYKTLPLTEWSEIKEGDYVVHINEGIGRFIGIEKIKIDGKEEEFIVIEYEGKDKLYVPVFQISLIHKYIGTEKPKMSKLGSKTWGKIKEKVKKSIKDLAYELYKLYTERKKEIGFKFPPDDDWQKEFEDSFVYEETPDQLKVIEEVKKDMMSEKIMDRIVCGDSGYGKTEVAMRAAFKSVLSGKQVVVLVPTTVLALQHYITFKERFSKFPVNIEMLSRLIPERKQREIIEKIKNGQIDIIIGTHRILQDDVEFKDIGLLIIDEEQRFGVIQKEKIKIKFRKVDLLTLTATPIPRTLNMALSGLKDISLIETPPEGRLSVITYVGKYNENIVREAILNEIEREGQVFYLHNYIYDIEKVKERIQKIIPFVKIDIAHGRMKPEQIADVMERFSEGKIDVLIATTIVENGLDIPNANTLIVDNALRYGLADLYQLRGRVGRGKWRAYAYFLIPPEYSLNEKVIKRLKAIQEFNNPGSGYKIALKDLEIRGAGNILGREQHGFIQMVGFNLYCQFWREVMEEIKGEKTKEKIREVKIKIPDDYISSPSMRFYLYREISKIKNKKDVENLIDQILDKFGYIPDELKEQIIKIDF
ncbi:MAG: transcription-repair coupling factor [Candidatus Omnitrophica bacterium]|nr:transcription-repair coupling factor [Candidatus Omnitrophota bacterium]MCM8802390.1 transcription-repair coupling factor [Candidatus Omnitrophota bacterium]